jgi:hypothetical protein
MTKNQKILLGLAAAGVGIFLLMKSKKTETSISERTSISESEKMTLFSNAYPTRYGTAPSEEIRKRHEQIETEAKRQINKLGLQEEYKAYVQSRANEPLPS